MTQQKYHMGCKKSILTGKEKQYHEHFKSRDLVQLPTKVDLRDTGFVPAVLDQGNLNTIGVEKQQEYENK